MSLKAKPVRTTEDALEDSKGVMRLSELVSETTLPETEVRQELDRLAIDGKITRFPVGNHIIVRWEGDG